MPPVFDLAKHHLRVERSDIFFVTYTICQVVLAARTEHKLQAVAEEITSAGGEAIVVVSDVSKVKHNCGI